VSPDAEIPELREQARIIASYMLTAHYALSYAPLALEHSVRILLEQGMIEIGPNFETGPRHGR
jgi:hypothetical protein